LCWCIADRRRPVFCSAIELNYPTSKTYHKKKQIDKTSVYRILRGGSKGEGVVREPAGWKPGAQPRFQSWGVQFLGLGYCTEQNTDGIPSFVDCSLLRNGNHTLHQKSWGGPSKFLGVRTPLTPSGCALWAAAFRLHRYLPGTTCAAISGR